MHVAVRNLIFARGVIHILPDETAWKRKYPRVRFRQKKGLFPSASQCLRGFRGFYTVLFLTLRFLTYVFLLISTFSLGYIFEMETFSIFHMDKGLKPSESRANRAFQFLFNIILIIRQIIFIHLCTFTPICQAFKIILLPLFNFTLCSSYYCLFLCSSVNVSAENFICLLFIYYSIILLII